MVNRIGIDARFMLRPMRGIPLYVNRLCEHLPRDKSLEFVFFINKGFEHNDRSDIYMPRINRIKERNKNILFVNQNSEGEVLWEQFYLPQLVKRYKVDLLHMPANRACYWPGVPMVVTLHDAMEYRFLMGQKYPLSWAQNRSLRSLFYNARARLYVLSMYKLGLHRAKQTITVSHYSAGDMVRYLGYRAETLHVIHHGLDGGYRMEKVLEKKDRTHTLMLGGDSLQKNPNTALKAWAKVDPVLRGKYPLKIVGFCGGISSPLLAAIRELGLEKEVSVKGWVDQQQLVDLFKRAALFLFPSRYEGFGFPLIQAMAAGTPMICSNTSSIPEIVGQAGLKYDPDDHRGMAEGMTALLSQINDWNQQSSKGLDRAEQFDWEKSAAMHIKTYRELL